MCKKIVFLLDYIWAGGYVKFSLFETGFDSAGYRVIQKYNTFWHFELHMNVFKINMLFL